MDEKTVFPNLQAIETATNGVDSLGGPAAVPASSGGRDRARPSLVQTKPFNCRSNRFLLYADRGIHLGKDRRNCLAQLGGKALADLVEVIG